MKAYILLFFLLSISYSGLSQYNWQYTGNVTADKARWQLIENTSTNEQLGVVWDMSDVGNIPQGGEMYMLHSSGKYFVSQNPSLKSLYIMNQTMCNYQEFPTLTVKPSQCSSTIRSMTATCTSGTVAWYSMYNLQNPEGIGNTFTKDISSLGGGIVDYSYYVRCENANASCHSPFMKVKFTEPNEFFYSTLNISVTPSTIVSGQTAILDGRCLEYNGNYAFWYSDAAMTKQIPQNPLNPLVTAVSPTSNTTYYVKCGNFDGCTGTSTANRTVTVINLPSPDVTNSTICGGTSTNLLGTCVTGTINWYSDVNLTSLLSGLNVTPGSTRSYYATCEYGGVKSAMSIATIAVAAAPSIPSTEAARTICQNESTTLLGNCNTGTIQWYSNSGLTTVLSNNTVSPGGTTTYYAACVSGTCKSNAVPTTVTVTPGLTLTAASFSKTNTQNTYKTDGRVSISSLTSNTTYRIGYNFNGVPQSPVSYTANASGLLNLTGFTSGDYNSFKVSNPSGCSSGIVTSTQVIN